MEKLIVPLLVLVVSTAFARGGWENIIGNGTLKKESRQVGNFSGLQSRGSVDVIVSYGTSNSIEVEADDNLLPYIETTVESGKLVVKTKDRIGVSSKNQITVRIQMSKMDEISLSGNGNITGDGEFTGSGKTKLSVSGSGDVKLSFANFDQVDVRISGSGDMHLAKGTTKSLSVQIHGSGKLDASSISTDDLDARISGSGDIKAQVQNSIKAQVSGSGTIFYSGNAKNISSRASGSGKIVKV